MNQYDKFIEDVSFSLNKLETIWWELESTRQKNFFLSEIESLHFSSINENLIKLKGDLFKFLIHLASQKGTKNETR